eukprot:TRINITY_DN32720_c0_g1_i1.p1 TRINITY_DN32720_c0_g1~~TRINITY_DN32720_c0_g1_i1.p1  ORF type:complete len:717 (-),score=200.45 TRINITY_DN32720_c0_g1_i1:65-2215(-)
MPLSAPVTATAVERAAAGTNGVAAAAACMQGIRNNFEDTHILDVKNSVFAVFDGHLGDEAAAFCKERMVAHLLARPHSKEGMADAFYAADDEMRANLQSGSEAGATACVVRISSEGGKLSLTVANCGDSRAVLWRKASGELQETRDHRPSDPEEKKRIEAAGGTVSEEFDPPRIDGQLACSRALGAFKYKQDSSRPPAEQKVSTAPDLFEWPCEKGDVLIIGCDGVWDTLSSQQVVDAVCKAEEGSDLGAVVQKVLDTCIAKEADDNLSLLAVRIGEEVAADKANELEVTAGNFLKTKDKEVIEQYEAFCMRFGYELKKEMVPKKPPIAKLSKVEEAKPGPRFLKLPMPEKKGLATLMPRVVSGLTPSTRHRDIGNAGEAKVEVNGVKNGHINGVTNGVNGHVNGVSVNGVSHDKKKDDASSAAVEELPPLVICGPSGAGKGTFLAKLFDTFPGRFGFSVSHTTRGPRPGEVDGKDYHFTNLEDMQKEVDGGAFIEYANVHGNMYGTSKTAVENVSKAGKICVLDIDVQGVKSVKQSGAFAHAKYCFLSIPSIEILEKRLRGRGTETEEKIQKRLGNARGELEYSKEEGAFDRVVVNESLDPSFRKFADVIREFYPSLTKEMRVTAKKSPKFYINAAKELFAEAPTGQQPQELQVTALGDAIPAAAAVVSALEADGHSLFRIETGLAGSGGAEGKGRSRTAPQFRAILRHASLQKH